MAMIHEGQKKFKCEKCNIFFDRKYKLLDHTRGKDQCKSTNKPFQKVTTIKTKIVNVKSGQNLRVNPQEKVEDKNSTNKCSTCDENFKTPGHLKSHIIREHGRLLKSKNSQMVKKS